MNAKPKLAYLSFLMGIVLFSYQAVTAQNETASAFPAPANPDGKIYAGMQSITSVTTLNYALPVLNSPLGVYAGLNQESKEFYLNKSKNQKTTAWVLLGAGSALAIVGLIGFDANFDIWSGSDAQSRRADFFGFMALTGMVADVISIPFFISAHRNKKIASTISIGNQNSYVPLINSHSRNVNPILTLKVNF